MSVVQNSVVLVAGGAGFIGSALVRELLEQNVTVVSYDNYLHGSYNNYENLENAISANRLIALQGDVCDEKHLKDVLSKYHVDFVVNCIGDPFIPATSHHPTRCYEVNAEGTLHILNSTKAMHVKRTIHVSTCEVYGINSLSELSEDAPLNPCSVYAKSKYEAERFCTQLFPSCEQSEQNTPLVIARLFNCYGPRATHPYVIPEIIKQLSESHVLHLGRLTERDFTYVHDTAKALVTLLETSFLAPGHNSKDVEVVNIGSGVAYPIDYLVQKLADIMEVPNVTIVNDESGDRYRRQDIPRFVCNNKKLRHYTHWAPEVTIEEGLRKTVAWFKEQGCRWKFSQND